MSSEIWQKVIFNNTLQQYLLAFIALIFFLLLFNIIQNLILLRFEKIAQREHSKAGDIFIHILQSIKPPFYYFLAFYIALNFLSLEPPATKIINIILIIWVVCQAIVCVQIFIDYLIRRSMTAEREKDAKAAIGLIKVISSIILWVVGALFLFSNLGINITSLVAGLGIGGIALALAVQNILKDLFSSFAIYFDKPFAVGDYIAIGDTEGIVRQIGIKTTRMQALQGEEVIVSNQDLTSGKIKNFSKLKERKISFNFNLAPTTKQAVLEKLDLEIGKVFEKLELTKYKRTTLISFDKDGYKFETIFFILSNQMDVHFEVQEQVLLKIKVVLDDLDCKLA